MNIINGKNASAVIFAAEIEAEAIAFVEGLCDSPAMAGSRIAQMPDVHHGKDCNVGTVYTVGNYLNPSHIGGDIGCAVSMHGLSVPVSSDGFALLDHRIREAIPTGIEICSKNNLDEKEFFRFINSQYQKAYSAQPGLIAPVSRVDAGFVSTLCRRLKISEGMFYKSIGTLGGGNHFIEYGEDGETGQGWLTIHTGSRNFGQKVDIGRVWPEIRAGRRSRAISVVNISAAIFPTWCLRRHMRSSTTSSYATAYSLSCGNLGR